MLSRPKEDNVLSLLDADTVCDNLQQIWNKIEQHDVDYGTYVITKEKEKEVDEKINVITNYCKLFFPYCIWLNNCTKYSSAIKTIRKLRCKCFWQLLDHLFYLHYALTKLNKLWCAQYITKIDNLRKDIIKKREEINLHTIKLNQHTRYPTT